MPKRASEDSNEDTGDSKKSSKSKRQAMRSIETQLQLDSLQVIMATILERLDEGEVVIGDGGYITEMERRGYATAGHWTPEVNVEHPQAVAELHKEFARAGSDILQAFTFFASDDMLHNRIDMEGDIINESACNTVKKIAAERGLLWAGGLSLTECYKGGGSKEDVQKLFRKQTRIFVDNDADLLIAEYFDCCEEIEWAVEVLKETGKPVAASMCINSTSDAKGVPTDECAVRLVNTGANIVGVNCVFDPDESIKAVVKMKEGLEKSGLKAHLMVQPLGFHCPDGGKNGYLSLPEYPFALESRELTRWDVHKITRNAYDAGIRYIGGCCGFKSYHIRAIAEELATERGRSAESSEKHKPFAGNLYMGDSATPKTKEFWMNLKPGSGRPFCAAFSNAAPNNGAQTR